MTNFIWNKFKELFPSYAENVKDYRESGRHSIRMRAKDGSEFIFTYNGIIDYTLEVTRKRRQK